MQEGDLGGDAGPICVCARQSENETEPRTKSGGFGVYKYVLPMLYRIA